jgi:hypothetical protein
MPEGSGWNRAATWARRFLESMSGVFLLAFLFTLAMLYNYIVPLKAVPFSEGVKGQDCYQMVWNLWVVNEAITSGHNPYRTDLIYYPLGAQLSHHSLSAGFFILTLPVKLLSRGDVMYPFRAYRITILLSFTLILYFSYLTLREFGSTRWASAIPAVAYAFGAYYMEHLIHLNQIAGFFIPLTALCLVRSYQQPSTTRLMATALVSSCAIYFTELALYIYMGILFLVVLMSMFSQERIALAERIRLAGIKRLLSALAVFVLILSPFLFSFFSLQSLKPAPDESSLYSSNLVGFFIPVPDHTPLYGRLFSPLTSGITVGMGEPFVSFPLLLLALAALIRSKKKLVRMSALLSLLFFVLSLGPTLKVLGTDTGIPLPYALLMRVPPFDLSRGPVRFVVMGIFLLMIVAASGASLLDCGLTKRWGSRWSGMVMSLLFFWTVAESHSPVHRQEVITSPRGLERILKGPVLNLPLVRNDGYSEMLQIFHRQPIATGYLARYTEQQAQHFADLERLFSKGGSKFCEGVAAMRYRNIVIAPRDVVPGAPSIVPLELSKCSINVIDLRSGDIYAQANRAEQGGAEKPDEFPLYAISMRVDFSLPESDKFLWYGWSAREPAFRWTDRNKAAVVFALGELRPAVLRMKFGAFVVPGKLEEQRVNVELNGVQIKELRLRSAEPKEYSMALPAGFLQEKNVLTFALPDAESPAAFELSSDARLLGINVHWMEID